MVLFLTSTKFPTREPDFKIVPGLNLANGPTITLFSILTFSKCENDFILELFCILTFSPKTTYGSIVTFFPIVVSFEK